jgi:hypothetical protein
VSSFFLLDETTPNCSKAPLRWWGLLAFKFWPSRFRAAAVISFFMFEHDGMPKTAIGYSVGYGISETQSFCACRSPKNTGLFLISAVQLNVNYPNSTFHRSLYCFYRVLLY